MDSTEKGLMAGPGNIGKESFEALNGKEADEILKRFVDLGRSEFGTMSRFDFFNALNEILLDAEKYLGR